MPPYTAGFNNSMANQIFSSQEIEVKTDPSFAAADDLSTIQYLAQIDEHYESTREEMRMVDLKVNSQLDMSKPCDLPSCFVKKGPTIPWSKQVSNPIPLQHQHGAWSAVRDSFSAIRDTVTTDGGAGLIGFKKSLEFILKDKDGTKTGWLMVEYYLLAKIEDANCEIRYLRDEVVLCKLFNLERSGHVHIKNTAGEVTNQASHDHDPTQTPIESIEEPAAGGSDDIYGGLTPIIDLPTELEDENQGRSTHISSRSGCYKKRRFLERDEERQPTKRSKQGSPVWEYYTKIIKSGDDKVVFAACKICNKMFSAHSKKDGTANLLGHIEACIVKHPVGGVAPGHSPCLGESFSFWSNLKNVEAYLMGD